MLREDKLDTFLDAFLEGRENPPKVDLDFWEEAEKIRQPEKERFWDYQEILTAPKGKGKLPPRTIASVFLILILIPVIIFGGIRYWDDRKYLKVSLAIAFLSTVPFFMVFEGRKPQTKELLTISVLAAIAVAGRAAFFMVPSFKPVAAVVIISGVCFGAEAGFMVGAVSMLASNMLFGQGPWTPWQMFAMGIIGFLAGILFQKGWLKARKGSLCIYGFLATLFIYGGIMNPASLVMMSYAITKKNLLAIYISGLPVDFVHASATVTFLFLAARPMIEKLERIKIKYGMIQE
ncbi:ECF transporter S component [Novisyntrophococcus fermenticellae]|uniref:ECF transporter S component n=1 Tax=Novisyntrophococcus fermenticellae TaxID=2068655 RepID=UPI001E355C2C|nr:ECF transporter S component [Novisyntrophococcus fermenticellae]